MSMAILVHGMPSKDEYYSADYPTMSNSHWFPWLSKQLQVRDIFTVAPEFPDSYRPRYDKWLKEFERYELSKATTLVGHSCGGGFLVRYLTENPNVRVNKVILVAPWMNPGGNDGDTADFFEFEIRPEITQQAGKFLVINSTDDHETIHATVKDLREKLKDLHYREFRGKGHFCLEDLGTEAFPELLEEILG